MKQMDFWRGEKKKKKHLLFYFESSPMDPRDWRHPQSSRPPHPALAHTPLQRTPLSGGENRKGREALTPAKSQPLLFCLGNSLGREEVTAGVHSRGLCVYEDPLGPGKTRCKPQGYWAFTSCSENILVNIWSIIYRHASNEKGPRVSLAQDWWSLSLHSSCNIVIIVWITLGNHWSLLSRES